MSINQTIVVSGLPRSGTSMMMHMLEAGGIDIITDKERKADEDNPNGYYELEIVKRMTRENVGWLKKSSGKAVKIISQLLKDLPAEHEYKVIFMHRNMKEILASQKQMLIHRGEPTDRVNDTELAMLFHRHLAEIEQWLCIQKNFDVLHISYNDVLRHPAANVQKVVKFLSANLNSEKMIGIVDKALYRQKQEMQ